MRKLMLLAAMSAMVLMVAAPALAQQGGDQYSVNVANAVNDCDQYFEQNQVAVQENDIDQDADQDSDQAQDVIAAIAAGDDIKVDDEGNVVAEAAGNQYSLQVGNVAAPVQAVNQEGAAAQYCTAIANAFTIQYQNNESVTVDEGTTTGGTTTGGSTSGGSTSGGSTSGGSTSGGTTSGGTTSGGKAPAAALPATGGFSLLALGAGALLVGGGLVARRVIR